MTPEDRAEKRTSVLLSEVYAGLPKPVHEITQRKVNERTKDWSHGFAACIREQVEPLEAEVIRLRHKAEVFDQLDAYGCSSAKIWLDKCDEGAKLRALVQAGNVMREAIQLHMEDHVFDNRTPYGTEYDMNEAATAWDAAKEQGFVPTNTEDK